MNLHTSIAQVTERIIARSQELRASYVALMQSQIRTTPARGRLSCSNLAHVMAASGEDKPNIGYSGLPNIGVVTAYNDMLSAHQPYEHYPEKLLLGRVHVVLLRKWRAACQPCAMVLPKVGRAWS